jgi:hypothetical protein
VLYGPALFRVQPFEMRKGHRLRSAGHSGHPTTIHVLFATVFFSHGPAAWLNPRLRVNQ